MTANEFVEKVKNFAPSKEFYLKMTSDFSESYSDMISNRYTIKYIGEIRKTKYELIDLVCNYDMSKVGIGMITFEKNILETKEFYFFGHFEGDLLAIHKNTNEIVMVDYEDPSFIISFCAANCNCFLGALNLVWQTLTLFLLDDNKAKDNNYISKIINECSELAGGKKYTDFYTDFLAD